MSRSEELSGPIPTHGELATELRLLREKGVIKLRRLHLPALTIAARAAGIDTTAAGASAAVETLLRTAVSALGDEEPGTAARYLFGLVQGTIGRNPTDLRERAAQVYGRSPETFRKERERLLIDRIADEILLLCLVRTREAGRPDQVEEPLQSPGSGAAAVLEQIASDLQRLLLSDDQDDAVHRIGTYGPYPIAIRETTCLVAVHLGPIELVRGIDIITTSTNVYLAPSRTYAATLAGRIRAAAAIRDAAGTIVQDEVADDLAAWVRKHATAGRPVPTGTVVATSPGRLAERGVRRLYHAAVAEPLTDSNAYTVSGAAISRSVEQCFALARSEQGAHDPPLQSISLPLFGTGRAAMTPQTSFSWLWPALVAELQVDADWRIHFSTWHPAEAVAVLRGLHRHQDGS